MTSWEPARSIGAAPGTLPSTEMLDDLTELRASAGKWQSAQLGIIGLISLIGIVKGGSDIRKLPDDAAVMTGIVLGLAFFSALWAIYLVAFVAYRLPMPRLRSGGDPDVHAFMATQRAAKRLRAGVGLTFVAAVLAAAAVALTWYVKDEGAATRVRAVTPARTACGMLVDASPQRTTMIVDGRRTVLPGAALITPATSCP